MSSRIQVTYTKTEPHLVGKTRWLDTESGHLFELRDDRDCDAVSTQYKPGAILGTWANGRSTVTAVAQTLPAPPVGHTQYAGGNPKAAQGAKKYSLRYLPLPAAIEVNRALEDGATKYGPANWRETGVAASVYVDAALRHLAQWYDGGQENAADSKVHNLGHAMACLAIIIDAQVNGKLIDDRPHACVDTDALLKR